MVNRTCRDVVNESHDFQKKLFMERDSPEGDEQYWIDNFGPEELRLNPFLEHFAVPLESGRGIRIKRKHLRKHDHAEASWKKMFLTYPTRMEFYAYLEGRFIIDGILNCPYYSKVMAENMDFLVEADRTCYHHDHNGNRSTRNNFIVYVKGWQQGPVWRKEPVWELPEKRLRSYEELQAEAIENEVCDERFISEISETLGRRGTLYNTHTELPMNTMLDRRLDSPVNA